MLKGLLEKRAAKVAEMRSINESAKSREEQRMTAEEAERFDAIEKEVAELDKEIHRAEVMEKEDMRKTQQRAATTSTDTAAEQKCRSNRYEDIFSYFFHNCISPFSV
jgi:predicted phage gp36 major capsid-like protein